MYAFMRLRPEIIVYIKTLPAVPKSDLFNA